ncbi:hypothetical protein Ddc_14210 [Ditylenchus destructor]|nr:hypothetical protein Ddc_14210 [Ditylenchus destructor]
MRQLFLIFLMCWLSVEMCEAGAGSKLVGGAIALIILAPLLTCCCVIGIVIACGMYFKKRTPRHQERDICVEYTHNMQPQTHYIPV